MDALHAIRVCKASKKSLVAQRDHSAFFSMELKEWLGRSWKKRRRRGEEQANSRAGRNGWLFLVGGCGSGTTMRSLTIEFGRSIRNCNRGVNKSLEKDRKCEENYTVITCL